jgi:polygalacturonase
MDVDRRSLLAISLATGTLADPQPTPVGSIAPSTSMTSITALGVNAVYLGVQPGSPDDQTRVLQRAIERASGAGVPLVLPPGVYRAGQLELPTGTHLIGMPGATRLILAQDRNWRYPIDFSSFDFTRRPHA